jgi:hypothetical protein
MPRNLKTSQTNCTASTVDEDDFARLALRPVCVETKDGPHSMSAIIQRLTMKNPQITDAKPHFFPLSHVPEHQLPTNVRLLKVLGHQKRQTFQTFWTVTP